MDSARGADTTYMNATTHLALTTSTGHVLVPLNLLSYGPDYSRPAAECVVDAVHMATLGDWDGAAYWGDQVANLSPWYRKGVTVY